MMPADMATHLSARAARALFPGRPPALGVLALAAVFVAQLLLAGAHVHTAKGATDADHADTSALHDCSLCQHANADAGLTTSLALPVCQFSTVASTRVRHYAVPPHRVRVCSRGPPAVARSAGEPDDTPTSIG